MRVIARKLLRLSLEHTTQEERKRSSLLSRMMTDVAGQVFTTCLTDRAYRSQEPARVVDTARQLLRTLGVPRYLPSDARAMHGLEASGLSRPLLNLGTVGLSRTLRWALTQ